MYRLNLKIPVIGFVFLVACSSGNSDVYDLAQFTRDLNEKNVTPERAIGANSVILERESTVISWDDISVDAFEYPDWPAAQAAADQIVEYESRTGELTGAPVNWSATPHFFRKGRLMVLYVGDDRPTADLLKQVLGPQFAGGHGVPEE